MPLNLSVNQSKTPKDASKKQGLKFDDRLNLSVEVGSRQASNKIDNNLRLSRITEEKHNISVDGISSRGHSKEEPLNKLIGELEEDKAKGDYQQSSLAIDIKSPNMQLNLENLVKIEDRLSNLIENLRQ